MNGNGVIRSGYPFGWGAYESTLVRGDGMYVFDQNGKRYLLATMQAGENAPPFHPNCRCTILPVVGEEERLAKKADEPGFAVAKTGESGIIIADLTNHATERMEQREVADVDVEDAKMNPLYTKPIVVDAQGRKSQIIIGKKATICINPESGRIITTWKTSSRLRRKYGGGD